MKIGIDIASVDRNKPADWLAAKGAGVAFAIFRANYSTWEDPTWAIEASRARDAGIIVGAYIMPDYRAGAPEPEAQMLAFANHVHCASSDFPPTIDVEFSSIAATGRTRRQILEWIVRAVAELHRLFGLPPMIYTSTRVFDGEDTDALDADEKGGAGVDLSPFVDCWLWLARYPWTHGVAPQTAAFGAVTPPAPPKLWGPGAMDIHQLQGDSIGLPGFSSTVDLNVFASLRLGSTGPRVRRVERALELAPTGLFDDRLRQAVIAFQASTGLVADGVVGPATMARLAWAQTDAARRAAIERNVGHQICQS